jgi:hypothetical protein
VPTALGVVTGRTIAMVGSTVGSGARAALAHVTFLVRDVSSK